MKKSILLAGTIDAIGQTRLPRLFHDAGCTVSLLAPPTTAIWRSRYLAGRLPLPSQPAGAAATLHHHLRQHTYTRVVILDEPLLWVLAESPDAECFRAWFPVDVTDRAALWTAFSKVAFVIACAAAGAAVPEFEFFADVRAAASKAAMLGYPVVLKIEHGLAGSGVRVVHSERELYAEFAKLSAGSAVILQRFINGPVGTCPVLFDRGRPVCWFAAYTREHWPTPYSASSAIEVVHRPELRAQLEAVGNATSFHGLAGVDWVEDPQTGRLYILELNPRPTPATYLGGMAGVNFPGAIAAWLHGEYAQQEPSPAADGTLVRMFPQALYYAFDQRRARSIPGVLGNAPWDEPALVAAHLRRMVGHFLPAPVRGFARRVTRRRAAAA